MRHQSRAAFLLVAALLLDIGCTPGRSADSRGTPGPPARAAMASGSTALTNPCERKTLTKDDVEGILRGSITETGTLEGDRQSCTFNSAAFQSLTVSVRPGLGNVTVATWASGKMPASAVPLPGIGDRAVWSDEMHELIATKNNVLCDIAAMGSALSAAALQQRLESLCAKVFSAQ